jgi:hypothetical protein
MNYNELIAILSNEGFIERKKQIKLGYLGRSKTRLSVVNL